MALSDELLTEKQQKFFRAMPGKTWAEAAKEAGVTIRAVQKWKKQPAFVERMSDYQRAVAINTGATLGEKVGEASSLAVDVVIAQLQAPDLGPKDAAALSNAVRAWAQLALDSSKDLEAKQEHIRKMMEAAEARAKEEADD